MNAVALLAAAFVAAPPVEPAPSVSVVASTRVGLDGACTTELALTVRTSPIALHLPPAVSEVQLETEGGLRAKSQRTGDRVVISAGPGSRLRLTYRQKLAAFGFRGRFRVVLPRFERPVDELRWELVLPFGLAYSGLQSSVEAAAECNPEAPQPCFAHSARQLAPAEAYVEGEYVQPLAR